ncbi:hypothetical protein IAR55_003720 [Kwoniella newhampshirensis]|uniref:Major facilitator superfamily (MFS) profile domain-containing protein n=1 Tax=Kwoniella newhampshirensis TaxID=1651941 RepID=A0AAW0YK89_9TREE
MSSTDEHDAAAKESGLDQGVQVLEANDGRKAQESELVHIDYTDKEERQIVRKIDAIVLLLFACIYMFQYLDKIALSYAAIFGLRTDLHLHGQEYSWASSIFYFGQFAFEWVGIYLLHKLPIKQVVGVSIVIWGAIMMCLAAANSFAGLATVRFFLGLAEGAVAPAFVILTSFWWKKKEQPIRVATFVSANAMAQIVGALLLYGCGSIKNASIKGFKISFLLAGGITILLGVTFLLVIPLTPATAWFLTPRQREIAVYRVARERASFQHNQFDMQQAWATFKDPRLYLVFLWAVLVCMTSVVVFGSIVINGLGFSPFRTLLIGLPGPAIQLLTIWLGVIGIWFFPNGRGIIQCLLILPPWIGCIMLYSLPYADKWALTGGYWLATCNSSVFVVNMSLIASNFKGHTRKTIVSFAYFIGYCVGCIAGPQMFLATETPTYPTAMRACIGLYAVYIVAQVAYLALSYYENKRRDKLAAAGDDSAIPRPASDEDNRTDLEDLSFRYVL